MKLLLLEDDPKVADFITKGLREAGFVVEHTTQGEVALSLAQSEEYDAECWIHGSRLGVDFP